MAPRTVGPGGGSPRPGGSQTVHSIGWADVHGAGYAAWTWDSWGTCGSLVSGYDGTAANDYARWVHDFYAAHAATTYHPVDSRTEA